MDFRNRSSLRVVLDCVVSIVDELVPAPLTSLDDDPLTIIEESSGVLPVVSVELACKVVKDELLPNTVFLDNRPPSWHLLEK